MNVVTVSSRHQIVIPKKVRESLGIEPGQKMHVFQNGDHVEVVPLRDERIERIDSSAWLQRR